MNRVRYLAASLLCLTGLIHSALLGMADAPAVIVVAFGVAYLIIGALLFFNNKTARYLGAIVPVVGLCLGPVILKNPPIPFAAFLGAVEITVVVCCLSLIRRGRRATRVPRSG